MKTRKKIVSHIKIFVFDVVEKHGGTMQVVNAEGEGAEFIILLPLLPELHL